MSAERIECVMAALHPYGCNLLAEKVESRAVFEHTCEIGFSLFQGYFFSKPEVVPGRKITTSQLSRLRLLREVSDPRIDVAGLARIVASDPGLSHRLLRHLSSAAFGRRGPVRSISQAALCLGRVALTQWLRVVLVSDLGTTPVSQEAASIAMQRARFLQQIAGVAPTRSESADSLFMLGLLSLVDAMLGLPMVEVCNDLPLHARHRAALCGERSPTRTWLDLVCALERAEWSTAIGMLNDLGVAPDTASRMYAEAHAWANAMTSPDA
jgi:EAL and modified HD-GYP domain-containing signal transduction protein